MLHEFQGRFPAIILAILAVAGFQFPLCGGAEETLKIAGVGSALGSMQLLGAAFVKSHRDIKVVVVPGLGTSGGIKAVWKDAIGIGLAARPLTEEERGLGLVSTEYARSPFVFVVRQDVRISDLRTGDIARILRGEVPTWPSGERIRLVLRPEYDTDTHIVKRISPEMQEALERALSREGMSIAMTDQEAAEWVRRTPGAFGFSTLTQIISEGLPLKVLSYNGVVPSVRTLADGSYPLFKSASIVTKGEPSDTVRRFISFVRSEKGMAILEQSGNLVIGPEAKR